MKPIFSVFGSIRIPQKMKRREDEEKMKGYDTAKNAASVLTIFRHRCIIIARKDPCRKERKEKPKWKRNRAEVGQRKRK